MINVETHISKIALTSSEDIPHTIRLICNIIYQVLILYSCSFSDQAKTVLMLLSPYVGQKLSSDARVGFIGAGAGGAAT